MEIKLPNGDTVLIDDADYSKVSKYQWRRYQSDRYVRGMVDGKMVSLHRFILNPPTGTSIDHINGDRLDNRRENLRFCSHAENSKNRKPNANGKSKYKGVVVLPNNRFRAKIDSDGKRYELGVYTSEREAVIAYNAAAKVLHGEHCYLNNLPNNTRADAAYPVTKEAARETAAWFKMFTPHIGHFAEGLIDKNCPIQTIRALLEAAAK